MTKLPQLPPPASGWPARRFAAYAARGETRLPECTKCGAIQYPPRVRCRHCLSPVARRWTAVTLTGVIAAESDIVHSLNDFFKSPDKPRILSVALDVGGTALAWQGEAGVSVGDPVRLFAVPDRRGNAVLVCAAADQTGMTTDMAELLMDPNRTIAGKSVCITGAAGGIGRELVSAFATAGAGTILACAREPVDPAIWGDAPVTPVCFDLTDANAVAELAAVHEIDILVNNAGLNRQSGFLSAGDDTAARTEIETNYLAPLALTRAIAPQFTARGTGVVVNILTMLAHAPHPSMASYSASKAAALSLTDGLRAEFRRYGVRVIGLFPGAVDTGMAATSPPPKLAPRRVADAAIEAIRDGLENCWVGAMAEDFRAKLEEDRDAAVAALGADLPDPR